MKRYCKDVGKIRKLLTGQHSVPDGWLNGPQNLKKQSLLHMASKCGKPEVIQDLVKGDEILTKGEPNSDMCSGSSYRNSESGRGLCG